MLDDLVQKMVGEVCGPERQREAEGGRETERQREAEGGRETERQREAEGGRERQREAEAEREQTNDADRSGPRPTVKMTEMLDAATEIFNGIDRATERQSERQSERQRHRGRESKRVPLVLSPYESTGPLPRR